jgi:hypothetical protein
VIPEDVQKFILQNIDSVAQLEGLLLFRANPQTGWNAKTVAQRLYISDSESAQLLLYLAARGLLREEAGIYLYHPEQETMVAKVADIYRRYLVPMTNLIHSRPKSRVQEFADAFKFRKEED